MTEATERVLDGARERLRLARSLDPRAEIEIHVRSSSRHRVVLEEGDGLARTLQGVETGTALRRTVASRRTGGFAASSDATAEGVRDLLEAAKHDAAPLSGDAWAFAGPGPSEADEDPGVERAPDAAGIESALRAAVRRLRSGIPRGVRPSVSGAWMETAVTRDALVNTRGVRLARARARTWMFLRLEWTAGSRRYEIPRLLAVRGAGALPDVEPLLLHASARARADLEIDPPSGGAVLLAPGSAAVLVDALVRTRHGEAGKLGVAVGPAYRILDDPASDRGLFGGRFDDAGWSTRPVRLADGRKVVGRLAGRGHLWRASYRDLPASRTSNLSLEPHGGEAIENVPVWFDLRVHGVTSDRWILEALVARPGDGGGRVLAEVCPERLPARFAATSGPAVRSANGVSTPAVLLDL